MSSPADLRIYKIVNKVDETQQVHIKGLGIREKEFVLSDVIPSPNFKLLIGKNDSAFPKHFSLRSALTISEKELMDMVFVEETNDEDFQWGLYRQDTASNETNEILNPNISE